MCLKKCTSCEDEKDVSEFYSEKHGKHGVASKCISCRKIKAKAYIRTKKGLVANIYNSQRGNSKKRGHLYPTYTNEELKEWLFSQQLFHHLHHLWKMSNYDSMLKPSVDRLSDYESYNFSNIQLMTWGENHHKGNMDRRNGNNTKAARRVRQYTKDLMFVEEFYSIEEACRRTGSRPSAVVGVCSGRKKTHNGFVWRYTNG